MIYKSAEELIGNTPLVELSNIEKELGLKCRILAKIEYLNPTGSSKDRAAKSIIDSAEKMGLIKEGGTIIEATSGNTGIGLSMIGTLRGYKVVIVMPDSMSRERILSIEAYGASVVLTPGSQGMAGAIKKAEEIKNITPNSFIASQFENEANAEAHYNTTGPEIYKNAEGCVDILVSAIGTGGTITGTAKYLKEKNKDTIICGIEPSASPLITKGVSGTHKIQGIGANFIPKILDMSLIDRVLTVDDTEAYEGARYLAKKEGLLVGISSGAALCGAIKLAKEYENKTIVVILPDTGLRYLSTDLF